MVICNWAHNYFALLQPSQHLTSLCSQLIHCRLYVYAVKQRVRLHVAGPWTYPACPGEVCSRVFCISLQQRVSLLEPHQVVVSNAHTPMGQQWHIALHPEDSSINASTEDCWEDISKHYHLCWVCTCVLGTRCHGMAVFG